MADRRVFITGMGIISAMGHGVAETLQALQQAATGIRPLTLFPCPIDTLLPVGEVRGLATGDDGVPRTHQLARVAAREALGDGQQVPDMVIMGVTTGGMLATENYMKEGGIASPGFRTTMPPARWPTWWPKNVAAGVRC